MRLSTTLWSSIAKRFSVLCLVSLFFISEGRAQDSTSSTKPDKRTKLGVIVPLTGPLAFFGKDLVRTYDLATEDHPDIRKWIEVVWEDSAYESKKAVAAFNKLVSIDGVDVIYCFGGPMLNALAPLAERQKIPFFATESQKSDCEGKTFCSLFRNEEDEWGRATWQALRANGHKKIGIVKNQNQFMDTFVDAIIRMKGADESVEVLIDVPPEAVDLRTETIALRSRPVDALGVYFLPNSHKGFLSALKNLNITIPMFGVEEFLHKETNEGFEETTNGTLVIVPGTVDSYREKFESRYGNSAGFFYTPAFYDFLVLLSDTVVSKSRLAGADLVKALQFDGWRNGVSGKYSVRTSAKGVRSYSFPIFVHRMTPGSLTVVDKISLD